VTKSPSTWALSNDALAGTKESPPKTASGLTPGTICGPGNYIQVFAKIRDLDESLGRGPALRVTTGALH
jgi:hypothetical protein